MLPEGRLTFVVYSDERGDPFLSFICAGFPAKKDRTLVT
jgi:hypothetical protein